MRQVTIDLETMGNLSTSAIMAIGAVTFDTGTTETNEFYVVVDLDSCLKKGLIVTASTVYWWLQQDSKAQLALCKETIPLTLALMDLSHFLKEEAVELIWTHATFDAPIMANAYAACELPVPWKYWAHRDIRTLEELKPYIEKPRIGVHHNALDDAKHQASYIRQLLESR